MIDQTEQTQLALVIKRLTYDEILHVASVITYALTEKSTFKRAFYDLCPPISSKFLMDAYHHGRIQDGIADITEHDQLVKLLFFCSVRLVALSNPCFVQAQPVYQAYEPGWFYIPCVEAEHVTSFAIYNPQSVQMGVCFVYKDRPDLDHINLKDGIDYELKLKTFLVAQINCGCKISL